MVLPERETEKREGSAGRKKYCPFTCTSLCFGSLMMEEPTLPIISLFSVGGVPASVWVCLCVGGMVGAGRENETIARESVMHG